MRTKLGSNWKNLIGSSKEETSKEFNVIMKSAGKKAGNYCSIVWNDGTHTYRMKKSRGTGFCTLVIRNGKLVVRKVFNTNNYGIHFNNMLKGLKNGDHLLIAAIDEASNNLSKESRNYLRKMGADRISKLCWECSYTFFGVVGRKDAQDDRLSRFSKVGKTYTLRILGKQDPKKVHRQCKRLMGGSDYYDYWGKSRYESCMRTKLGSNWKNFIGAMLHRQCKRLIGGSGYYDYWGKSRYESCMRINSGFNLKNGATSDYNVPANTKVAFNKKTVK